MTSWRALVVTAHPDDMEFGAAGTLAKWAAQGAEITLCIGTDGSTGTQDRALMGARLHEIRLEESQEAADLIGIKELIWLGLRDGYVEYTLDLAFCPLDERRAITLNAVRPGLVHRHRPRGPDDLPRRVLQIRERRRLAVPAVPSRLKLPQSELQAFLGTVKPAGPHHRLTSSGSDQACHTRSTGAEQDIALNAQVRVETRVCGFKATGSVLRGKVFQIATCLMAIRTQISITTIICQPTDHECHRLCCLESPVLAGVGGVNLVTGAAILMGGVGIARFDFGEVLAGSDHGAEGSARVTACAGIAGAFFNKGNAGTMQGLFPGGFLASDNGCVIVTLSTGDILDRHCWAGFTLRARWTQSKSSISRASLRSERPDWRASNTVPSPRIRRSSLASSKPSLEATIAQ